MHGQITYRCLDRRWDIFRGMLLIIGAVGTFQMQFGQEKVGIKGNLQPMEIFKKHILVTSSRERRQTKLRGPFNSTSVTVIVEEFRFHPFIHLFNFLKYF